MENEHQLDRADRAILRRLSDHGRATQFELGEAASLSGTAAARRQRAMETGGLIKGYRAVLDLEKMGYVTTVMVTIQLEQQSEECFSRFEQAVARCPSVVRCNLLSGSDDYLLVLRVRGLDDFERVHRHELAALPGVSRMQSSFSLREVVLRDVPPSILSGDI